MNVVPDKCFTYKCCTWSMLYLMKVIACWILYLMKVITWWMLYLMNVVPDEGCTCWRLYLMKVVPVEGCTCWRLYLMKVVPVEGCTWWRLYLLNVIQYVNHHLSTWPLPFRDIKKIFIDVVRGIQGLSKAEMTFVGQFTCLNNVGINILI
jgi:hypothetical protein